MDVRDLIAKKQMKRRGANRSRKEIDNSTSPSTERNELNMRQEGHKVGCVNFIGLPELQQELKGKRRKRKLYICISPFVCSINNNVKDNVFIYISQMMKLMLKELK